MLYVNEKAGVVRYSQIVVKFMSNCVEFMLAYLYKQLFILIMSFPDELKMAILLKLLFDIGSNSSYYESVKSIVRK